MPTGFEKENLRKYASSKRAAYEEILEKIVEIPTVSVEPDRKADVRRGAEYAVSLLESFGAKAGLWDTKGHPIVHGRYHRSDNVPTVTVYNHLDVQPAEGPDWETSPFEFVKKGDRYFGRGTTDDKGPAMTALFGARYAWEQDLPLNVDFLWELEEEIGSPHFETTTESVANSFACSRVSVSRSRPARPTSTRAPPAAPRAIRSPRCAR